MVSRMSDSESEPGSDASDSMVSSGKGLRARFSLVT